ncbi:hypothetical protein C5B94_03900 [Clavibacter michiganensis]|uniref:hypothetical protein n=1 Tax=Clavibacter michiganensis TaxID=28447 RepID=UPI000CE91109|nr:hypothetical protein [Clavibacter michiganensis]PPF56073.1 hypothetical protein C5B94_03900 [Clavibacter michiganensis]
MSAFPLGSAGVEDLALAARELHALLETDGETGGDWHRAMTRAAGYLDREIERRRERIAKSEEAVRQRLIQAAIAETPNVTSIARSRR